MTVGVSALDDDATAAALLEMQELLTWLQSGRKYVQLKDGSYVAPSARFRQSLRLISDLGADKGRALVSPLCIGLLRALDDAAATQAADVATKAWLAESEHTKGRQAARRSGDGPARLSESGSRLAGYAPPASAHWHPGGRHGPRKDAAGPGSPLACS